MSPGKRPENGGLGSNVPVPGCHRFKGFSHQTHLKSSVVWVSDTLLGSFYGLFFGNLCEVRLLVLEPCLFLGEKVCWRKNAAGPNRLFNEKMIESLTERRHLDIATTEGTQWLVSWTLMKVPELTENLKDFCWEPPYLMDKILSQLWLGCSLWLQTVQKWMWKSWFSCVFCPIAT